MIYNHIADGIDAIVIDNFYTENQLQQIQLELKWLTKSSIFLDEKSLVAAEEDGITLTKKSGVFLEHVFANWRHSALISSCIEQMNDKDFKEKVLSYNSMYKSLFACNVRSHLLSYYEHSDYYKPHTDSFFFTVLNYFNNEPKQFSGGEIVLYSCLNDKKAAIEPMNNRTVIIPSCTLHEVNPIVSEMTGSLSGNGRYCNAVFLNVVDERILNEKRMGLS